MEDLKNRLKEVNKFLKPYEILCWISLGIMIVGFIFIICDVALKNNVTDILFAVGIGLVSAIIVLNIAGAIILRKEIDEKYKIKKQLKAKK